MPKKSSAFVEYVVHDLLSELDGVQSRAMFGGYGIYRNGAIFAIVVDDELYFKVGPANRSEYEEAGSEPFTYRSKNRRKPVAMSYWKVPAHILEDRPEIARWAEKACQAALKVKKENVPGRS